MQAFLFLKCNQNVIYLTRSNISKLSLYRPINNGIRFKSHKIEPLVLSDNYAKIFTKKNFYDYKIHIDKIKYFVNLLNNKTLPALVNKLINIIQNISFGSSDQKILKKLTNELNLFKRSNYAQEKTPDMNKIPDFDDQNKKSSGNGPNKNHLVLIAILMSFISTQIMFYLFADRMKQFENQRIEEMNKKGTITINNQSSQQESVQQTTDAQSSKAQVNIKIHIKNGNTITWHDLVTQLIPNKLVTQIYASKNTQHATIMLKQPIEIDGHRYIYFNVNVSPEDIERKLAKSQDELNIKPEDRVPIVFKSIDTTISLMNLMGLVIISYVIFNVGRALFSKVQNVQSDLFSQFTKARFTVVDPHLKSGVPKITFKDVAGLHEAKIEVKEFVDYLSTPERFTKLGGRVPKGALLLGPPGCGKTLLAKAVAAEANVPFFNIAGTEFIEMIGGVGAARVRSLFEEAKKQSPSIIYIDEIDAVGGKRSGTNQAGASGELDQTLNQLLVSMDGLESNSNVIVLASTNRADILDKALLRPGRFDRHISIDLPTHLERIEILNVHMRNLKIDFDGKEKEEFVSRLSHLTPRFSGADLANICNESALLAARDGLTKISKIHFEAALERVIAGPEKKTSTISVEDRKLLAYHECGHVIISWFHQYSDLILKVSLLSRTKANVFSQYLPSDSKIFSKEELFDQMCLHFGGRVAESIVFNRFTTNSEQDLKKITKLAYAQIESFGMNDTVGNVSFPTREEQKATGSVGIKPYSKKLRNVIDLEVNKLISEAHKQAMETVNKNVDMLHKLANELLIKENLNYDDIVRLIGPPRNDRRYNLAKITLNTASPIPNKTE